MEYQNPDSKTYRNGKHRKVWFCRYCRLSFSLQGKLRHESSKIHIENDWTFSKCMEEDLKRGSYRVVQHPDDLLEDKWETIKKLWIGLGWLDLETPYLNVQKKIYLK